MEAITIKESAKLFALEAIIDSARETFVEVAKALVQIRDERLYRSDYQTFALYCEKRHGWAKSYGYNMAAAGEVLAQLGNGQNSTIVENPAQAVALARVSKEKRQEVLTEAAKGGKPTAAKIRNAAARIEAAPAESDPDERPHVVAGHPETEADLKPAKRPDLQPATIQAMDAIEVAMEDIKLVLGMFEERTATKDDCLASAMQLKKAAKALERAGEDWK